MADARDEILMRLPRTSIEPPALPRAVVEESREDRATWVVRFMRAAEANGVVVERLAGAGASRLAILAHIRHTTAGKVYASAAIDEAIPGLLDAMGMLDIDTIVLETEPARVNDAVEQPRLVGVGLTVAEAAWADSGTVVLRWAVPRSAAAVVWSPRVVILLPVARLFASQAVWLDHLRRAGTLLPTFDADLSLISGPSATRDVALTHVAGVYGAADIRVYVIEPEPIL